MSGALDGLRGLQEELSTDDARWWAEALGTLLVFGLMYRSVSHIVAALLAGIDPRVADTDVTTANAVAAIRDGEHVRVDWIGRMFATTFGILWLWVFDPSNAWLYVGLGGDIFRTVLAANVAVCLLDPAWFALEQLKQRGIHHGR